MQELAAIVDDLPRANKYVTQHLLKCLKKICENESKTKMNPGNLAVVFASNILRNGDPNANPFDMKYFETVNEIFKLVCFVSVSVSVCGRAASMEDHQRD